ncbi:MAG TPA: BatA domain-containing protein, partial [Magnetospirillum sp.]|nr:BatA domain-containing protein [Magnetospirillum sp.]
MWSLGPLAFAAPWALGAIAVLPVLWWLLRVVPPAPRQIGFPAIRLMLGLEGNEDTTARTPWWVMALRLLLAFLLILAAAHPLLNPGRPMGSATGPLVLVVDDGWASARDWQARRTFLDETLTRAERADRPVLLLPTAPPADGGKVEASTMMPAAQARPLVAALVPKPWKTDRAAATEAVKAIPRDRVAGVVWLSDGIDDGQAQAFGRALQSLGGGVELVQGASGRLLLPPTEGTVRDRLDVVVRRIPRGMEKVTVRAVDGAGRVLGREEAAMAADQGEVAVPLRLPAELRNRLARLDIEGEQGAGSVVLLDERWRRRPVGLASSGESGAPLLSQLTYVERALAPSADIKHGEISELLGGELAVLILADVPAVLGTTADKLARWVENGGVLVRFAGPLLAQTAADTEPDPLLPVRLRGGGRSLGGAM